MRSSGLAVKSDGIGEKLLVILRKAVPGVSESALARFVAKASREVGLRGVVNILVTTNRELQSLNRKFLGKNYATDVLSFPPIADLPVDFAGDIAISAEIAAKNAKQLRHSCAEEVKILALHGVLHLAGFDHERDNGKMARTEGRLRRKLGLSTALIERSVGGRSAPSEGARRPVAKPTRLAKSAVARQQDPTRTKTGRRRTQ